MAVTTYYFCTESGKSPVRDFIDSLDGSTQRKFFFVKGLLEEFGHRLPQPHAKYIGDDIFELRFIGKEGGIRILYFFFRQDKTIFTNGFVKKSDKIPTREKSVAQERRKVFLKKFGK
ncbi:MAG: type II toxin-antitoxin system RelE/ParE family toxin [Candidatus Omnitrophota bacterium]